MRSSLLRIALTIVLLIPALGGSSLAYVCEMDGQIRRECCCDHHAAKKDHCPELDKRGCCDVRSSGSEPVTKSTRTAPGHQPPVAVALAFATAGAVSPAARLPSDQFHQFRANGPPLFLRNCSLLR